jgi:hypothetical protein
MPPGRPIRLDHAAAVRGDALSRAALAFARSRFDPSSSPLEHARRAFAGDRAVELIVRAASAPASPTTSGWADVLAHVSTVFFASLVGPSAAADVFVRGLRVNFDGVGAIALPLIAVGSASFVGTGKPIPVTQFATASGVKLEPHKLALISVLTREMVESSNAEAIVGAALKESASYGLDAAFFSASAGTPAAPAGILNGVAALTPSTNADTWAAMISDLSAIGGAVARVAGSDVVFVAAPEQALAVALRAPDFGPVLASRALPAKTVVAVAANAVASGFDSAPVIEASRETELLLDTAPGEIVPQGGSLTYPTGTLFQGDKLALKMRMEAGWTLRAPNTVAWMSSVSW